MASKRHIAAHVEEDVAERLEKDADRLGVSVSELLRALILLHLETAEGKLADKVALYRVCKRAEKLLLEEA